VEPAGGSGAGETEFNFKISEGKLPEDCAGHEQYGAFEKEMEVAMDSVNFFGFPEIPAEHKQLLEAFGEVREVGRGEGGEGEREKGGRRRE
jgi:hypothetical protein